MRAALDVETGERAAWVQHACGADDALRVDVERLLAADAALNGPLDQPLREQINTASALRTDTADPRLGSRIGAYVLKEVLGHGGMGTVYRAERDDGGFAQTVAVKLLRAGRTEDPHARRRFARERQILVRLQHPHIARFLDGGVSEDGQPWYAMELVEGEPLTRHAERTHAPLAQRLNWLMQVCDAVQFAHGNLILHRDLKPANILIDAQGQAKLLDFGIATLLDDDLAGDAATQTAYELRAFTPDYAAPEQWRGEAVGTAADLYALGVIAFELLTGNRPFRRQGGTGLTLRDDDSQAAAPSRVLARESGDPRRAAALRGDLDTIVLTCLQTDPARRYDSAAALRRDIERHLAGLPIDARPDTFGYRTGKFLRRHRLATALIGLFLLTLVAATVISLDQAARAARESARANAYAATLQRERDAALDEVRRQETLREHFVVVLDRATAPGSAIAPSQLLALAADPSLLGQFGDARMQAALQLALSDLFLQRGDYVRALALLDALEPTLHDDRSITLAALNRADASIRIGQLDGADTALQRARKHMTSEQREGGFLPASLTMAHGQLLRARGDLSGAEAAAREAADAALEARDGSPLARGTLVGSGATAMLLAGDLDSAIRLADQAEQIWHAAGVGNNVFANTVATQRANALFLRGDLLAARDALRSIDSAGASESIPARAARDATHAKALALLAQPDDALRLIDSAVAAMCDTLGQDALDCLRMRLSRLDTRLLCGRIDLAADELNALAPILAKHPPLNAAARNLNAQLALLKTPDSTTAEDALLIALQDSAEAGALPRRNATRSLLMLAERFLDSGHDALAARLANAAIALSNPANAHEGMDAALIDGWRARLAEDAAAPSVLQALERALGANHPIVLRRQQRD